jgi:valyl-tRNA synthetase
MDHIDMNYTHSVGYHDRCGTLIEPLTVEQWWLKVDELKKPAIKAIKSGEIKFVPERFTKVALDWLENLHDWNISRQNWWGIRIPVYYNASGDQSKPPYIIGTEPRPKPLRRTATRPKPTTSTPGSAPANGPSPRSWPPATSTASTPPASWKPAATSSSSGSPA